MSDLKVRLVRLEPMRVACFRAVGANPERDAWEKLRSWAAPKGLLNNMGKHSIFGFNNPNPSKDRPEYGYEFWISVGPAVAGEREIEVKDFSGGLYAVASCRLQGDPEGSVPQVWRSLWDWVQASGKYKWRKTHELEQCGNPEADVKDIELDLYLPIEELTIDD